MAEPVTIGLTETQHEKLRLLKEHGHFPEMTDAYRCAIALALASAEESNLVGPTRTFLNVGSLDPDRAIFDVVKALKGPPDGDVYRTAERLAEWGVSELSRMASVGRLSFGQLLKRVEASSDMAD